MSELSTMIRPSWVALHGMAYSFIELDKAVVHVIRLVSFRCPSADGKRTCGIHTHTHTHTHTGILLTHKKEYISVSSDKVAEPITCYTE